MPVSAKASGERIGSIIEIRMAKDLLLTSSHIYIIRIKSGFIFVYSLCVQILVLLMHEKCQTQSLNGLSPIEGPAAVSVVYKASHPSIRPWASAGVCTGARDWFALSKEP
jgi:hypothetical protein